ncbi:hypothetical protein ACHAXT_003458 [Thalassiosira profunda]
MATDGLLPDDAAAAPEAVAAAAPAAAAAAAGGGAQPPIPCAISPQDAAKNAGVLLEQITLATLLTGDALKMTQEEPNVADANQVVGVLNEAIRALGGAFAKAQLVIARDEGLRIEGQMDSFLSMAWSQAETKRIKITQRRQNAQPPTEVSIDLRCVSADDDDTSAVYEQFSPRGDESLVSGASTRATAHHDDASRDDGEDQSSQSDGDQDGEERRYDLPDMSHGGCTINLKAKFADHMELSSRRASAFVDRTKSELGKDRTGEKVDGSGMHLMIANADSCTPFVATAMGFFLGMKKNGVPITSKDVAIAAAQLICLFETRMTAMSWAEKEEDPNRCDVYTEPLSAFMWIKDSIAISQSKNDGVKEPASEASDSKEKEWKEQPFVKASFSALKRFNKSEGRKLQKWQKLAPIPDRGRTFLSTVAHELVALRVLEIVAIEQLMKIALETENANKDDVGKFRALIGKYLPGQRTTGPPLKAAQVLEKVVVPVMNGDDSNDKGVAIKLSEVMATVLGLDECREDFVTADAPPIDVIIQDCTPEQLEGWKKQRTKSFLGSNERQPQRKQAARIVVLGVLAASCARTLCRQRIKEEVAMTFLFGAVTSPPSNFRKDKWCSFLFEPNSHNPSKENEVHIIEHLVRSDGKGNSVVQMYINSAADLMEYFRSDHTWLELTDDLVKREKKTLELISAYSDQLHCLVEVMNGKNQATNDKSAGDDRSASDDETAGDEDKTTDEEDQTTDDDEQKSQTTGI